MEVFNSKLARLLFGGYSAFTIGFVTFYKASSKAVRGRTRVHESIHRRQWVEFFILLSPFMLIGWWFVPLLGFYAWYLFEYLISLLVSLVANGVKFNRSYHSISLEMEAFNNQEQVDYLVRRIPFNWIRYLGNFGTRDDKKE